MTRPRPLARTPRLAVSLRRACGLTLIELMTVMIVLGVIITIAVAPAMRGMLARQRVQAVNAELLGDLQLARSELAQRGSNSTAPVGITFGSNGDITCYVVHVVKTGVTCDCTRAPGSVCDADPTAREIKTMQFARAVGTSVSASGPGGSKIEFEPPRGLPTPAGLVINVQDTLSGQLRTSLSPLGVPSVCSPDGSIRGVPASC